MKEIREQILTGERALFHSDGLEIYDSIFEDGESPLKESANIKVYDSMFRWKYPLWYCNNIQVKNCTIFEMGRAGIWYTNHLSVEDTIVEAPKNFRRCDDVTLRKVRFGNAAETMWHCSNVKLTDVFVNKGDYFAMNCKNMEIDGLELLGNYTFDGAQNVTIRNSKLLSKDAFWNSDNITVYDSFITGEYLGWNAKNLTLINCTIESLQGMCYINNLKMVNCKLINTTLAFEYSSVEATIDSKITSVINPSSGTITAKHIDTLIMEEDKIDPSKTKIICTENN